MTQINWRPSATLEILRARAELLRAIRKFFHERGVLEVDTPALSRHGTVDRHIDSLEVRGRGWLHTSPEFAMKRLLAAGSGPIFQLCHVFRDEQAGRFHNPEFMMLEWYRPGWDYRRLADEVEALFKICLGSQSTTPFERLSYQAAFQRDALLDPFTAPIADLKSGLARQDVPVPANITREEESSRDFWLDLWMGSVVGPKLGVGAPCFIYDFPPSQAALARIRNDAPPVAERFELFWKGIELANGFHELTDAGEQRVRFEADRAWRAVQGRGAPPYDANLIAALEAGMPEGSGVALGVDRLLMLMLGLAEIAQSMPFGSTRA